MIVYFWNQANESSKVFALSSIDFLTVSLQLNELGMKVYFDGSD